VLYRIRCPGFRIKVAIGLAPQRHAIVPLVAVRLGDEARIVAAAGQHEGGVCVHKQMTFEHRASWRDVVGFCRNGK
jgi:hypothetical protein